MLKPTQCRMEVKKLAHGEDEEYFDDGISMEWISPKMIAELKEKYRENPPSPEQQMREFLNMVAECQEEKRRKRSGK